MSRRVVKSGVEYWFPDRYDVKARELLDPELSPRENLWAMIHKVLVMGWYLWNEDDWNNPRKW